MGFAFWNAVYYDPAAPAKGQMTPVQSLEYGATREGVHVISAEEAQAMETRKAFQYIARRSGVEHVGEYRDGLFNAGGKADLEYEKQRAAESRSVMWKVVLSLKKEDADTYGYTNVDAWRHLLNREMPKVAAEYGIDPKNLVWNAAYHPIDKHGRDHHPHVHIYFYSTNENEGRMTKKRTKKALERCRSIMTNDIFRTELAPIRAEHTRARDELKQAFATYRYDADRARETGLADRMDRLAKSLPDHGKIVYGYMPEKVKQEVAGIVKTMIETQPEIKAAYETYRENYRTGLEVYNSKPAVIDAKMQRWEKQFLRPTDPNGRTDWHNAILRAARDLRDAERATVWRESMISAGSARWAELDDFTRQDVRQFVGLSAMSTLYDAEKDASMARWLSSLSAEHGQELPALMKQAQSDNWKRVYDAIEQKAEENTELMDRLKNETRLYLKPDEQTRLFTDVGDHPYPSALRDGTADAVRNETQRILQEQHIHASERTEQHVSQRFYDKAMHERAVDLFRNNPNAVNEDLWRSTGVLKYTATNPRRPCPDNIYDHAYTAVTRMIDQTSERDPALRDEWTKLVARSVSDPEFNGIDRMVDAALQVSSEMARQYYTTAHDLYAIEYREMFDAVARVRPIGKEIPNELRQLAHTLSDGSASGTAAALQAVTERADAARCRLLCRNDPQLRATVRACAADPHVRSLCTRGVPYDLLSETERATIRNAYVGRNAEMSASQVENAANRAMYREIQNEVARERSVQHAEHNVLGSLVLTTAMSVSRAVQSVSQNVAQNATHSPFKNKKRKKGKRNRQREQQDPRSPSQEYGNGPER